MLPSEAVSSSFGKIPWLYQASSLLVGFFYHPLPNLIINIELIKLIFRKLSLGILLILTILFVILI